MNSTTLLRSILFALPLFLAALCTKAQSFPVTGKITDQNGQALTGVTVEVKDSDARTVTNTEGEFQLTAPSANAILVFSYVGFSPQEVSVNSQRRLNISMMPVNTSLQDVVVVGYGTRRRTDVTGAISSINSEKIRSVPTTNLTQALQGRIAGIEATASSFRPGSGSRIVIRGNKSLRASGTSAAALSASDPLYVVDGIPVTYTIDDMNPSDIESVDVLKDASATAIYGSRGANGVIQITTKKGRAGKITLDYSGSVAVDNILMDLPVFNGPQMVDMWRQAFHTDGAYAPVGVAASGNMYFPNALADYKLFGGDPNMWSGVKDAYQYSVYNSPTSFVTVKRAATEQEKELMRNLRLTVLDSLDVYDPGKIRSYPWQDEFKRQGFTNSHSINLTAGTDKIRTSFNGSYFYQKGIDPGQDFVRYTVGNNTEFRPAKFITFGNSISYTNSTQNVTGIYGAASGMIPIVPPYDSAGNFILFPNGDRQIPSPANNLDRVLNETKVSRVFGNVYAELTLFKGLRYRAVFGLDARNVRNGVFNGTNTSARLDAPASASHTITNSRSWVYDNLLYYNFNIKNDHSFNITLLHEMQSLNKTDQVSLSAENLIFEQQKWYSLNRNTNAQVTGTGSFSASQLQSYMGRLEYGYKNRYLLTLSNRYDESSVLAEGNKGQYFPSAAFAWQINNEDFFNAQKIFNYAKLRLGIGRVGNSSIDPYQTGGPLDFVNYNWGNGTAAIGLAPRTFPRSELTWEVSTTQNLGVEFGVLNNRVNVVVDLYKTSTTNMLQTRTIPATNGVGSILVNLGEVSNKGIEVALNTVNLNQTNGLRWTTDIIFSRNKEKIVDIDGTGSDNLANLWFLGQPVRVYYNYINDGIFQYEDTLRGGILADYYRKKPSNYNPANPTTSLFNPGRIRPRDINGDTLITAADKVILGYDNADWTGSITNTFSYKNFELNFMIYFRKGGMYRHPRPALVGRFQSGRVNYWTPTNPSNEYQQPTRTSDVPTFWEVLGYRDGSFARVRNISLTYRFPQSILSRLHAANLSVYVNAVNPFLFHNKSDYDPETIPYAEQFTATTNNTGPNSFSYRSFVFGVRLGL